MHPTPNAPPHRRLLSLRTKLTLVFAGLMVILGVVLSATLGELLKRRMHSQAGESLRVVAEHAAKMLTRGIRYRSLEVEVLAKDENLWRQGLNSAQVKQTLARSQTLQPYNAWIGAVDTHGVVQSGTKHLLQGESVAQREWFLQGLKQVYMGDVHPAIQLEPLLGKSKTGESIRLLDFAAPIQVDGKTIGVLGLHGNWDWTADLIDSLSTSTNETQQLQLFIFDRDGSIIYAPNGQTHAFKAAGQSLPIVPPGSSKPNDPRISHVIRWEDGKDYLTSIVPVVNQHTVSDMGWTMVARAPVQTAFAEARSVNHLVVGGVAVAAFIGGLLAWWAARRFAVDLKTLAMAASAVQVSSRNGVASAMPQLNSSREVAILSEALGDMTNRLLSHNQEMENQVRLRTEQLQVANNALLQQAHTDPLTGLLNRRGLEARIDYAIALAHRAERPLSVLMIDIDHFKGINDRYGHAVGDAVLQQLAQQIEQRLRETDVIARLGGEEFVALLPDTGLEGAQRIAETLRQAVALHLHEGAGHISISVGISKMRAGERDAQELLQRSDEALYAAKRAGRNQVVVQA